MLCCHIEMPLDHKSINTEELSTSAHCFGQYQGKTILSIVLLTVLIMEFQWIVLFDLHLRYMKYRLLETNIVAYDDSLYRYSIIVYKVDCLHYFDAVPD